MKVPGKKLFIGILTAMLFAPLSSLQAGDNPKVQLNTNMGNIVLELNQEKAPKSVENFLQYVSDKFYDGTVFHRVIDGFMIQGGGFTQNLQKKTPRSPIKNEADNGLKNDDGTIAMARTNDPHSATAQFFINVKDNSFLNHKNEYPAGYGYAVFGRVVEGMSIVNKIKGVRTKNVGGMGNVPETPIEIKSVRKL